MGQVERDDECSLTREIEVNLSLLRRVNASFSLLYNNVHGTTVGFDWTSALAAELRAVSRCQVYVRIDDTLATQLEITLL